MLATLREIISLRKLSVAPPGDFKQPHKNAFVDAHPFVGLRPRSSNPDSATVSRVCACGKRVAVSQSERELFGIEIFDLQIPAIRYSDTFVASVEAAVKAKNDAVAAENTVNRIRHEGERKGVTTRAEAQIARAQAQKQSQILAAEG